MNKISTVVLPLLLLCPFAQAMDDSKKDALLIAAGAGLGVGTLVVAKKVVNTFGDRLEPLNKKLPKFLQWNKADANPSTTPGKPVVNSASEEQKRLQKLLAEHGEALRIQLISNSQLEKSANARDLENKALLAQLENLRAKLNARDDVFKSFIDLSGDLSLKNQSRNDELASLLKRANSLDLQEAKSEQAPADQPNLNDDGDIDQKLADATKDLVTEAK